MITSYVTNELGNLHDFEPNLQAKINWDIISLVNQFKAQGHLNESNTGRYMVNVLARVLAFKPVTPLTGEDAEWSFAAEQSTETTHIFTNLRCPSVVKEIDIATNAVKVLDYEAVVISSDGGLTWWEKEKCYANVEFPYLPPIVPSMLYVRAKEGSEDEYEVISDENEINALRELKIAEMQEAQAQASAQIAESNPDVIDAEVIGEAADSKEEAAVQETTAEEVASEEH